MKKKILKYVIEWILILSLLALYAFMFIDVLDSSTNVIYTIGLSALGILITIFLSSLAHELGHVVFGLFSGLKLHTITVLFIKLTFFDKGKYGRFFTITCYFI